MMLQAPTGSQGFSNPSGWMNNDVSKSHATFSLLHECFKIKPWLIDIG